MKRLDCYLLVAASAALCCFAACFQLAWPLGLFAWSPLLVVIFTESRWYRGLAWGLLHGVLATVACFWPVLRVVYGQSGESPAIAVVLFFVFVVYYALRTATLAALTVLLARRSLLMSALLFPAVLVAVEYFYPVLFPWHTSILVSSAPVLTQAAELGGPSLVSFWVASVSGLLALAWIKRGRKTTAFLLGGAAVTILGLVALLGSFRIVQVEQALRRAPSVRVGLVQGNLPKGQSAPDPVPFYREQSVELLKKHSVDLLVWPETAISYPVATDRLALSIATNAFRDPTRGTFEAQDTINTSLLTGVVERIESHATPEQTPSSVRDYNAAVLINPRGRIRGQYRKQVLVPFGEYVPLARHIPKLKTWFTLTNTMANGERPNVIEWGGHRLAVSICYEDLLPGLVRDNVLRTEPELLINLTSDTQFGRSRIPYLHFKLARLRAIEHRRYLLRATNDGITAAISPTGRLEASLPAHERGALVTEARWLSLSTPFQRYGAWPAWVALGGLLLTALLRKVQDVHDRQRHRGTQSHDSRRSQC